MPEAEPRRWLGASLDLKAVRRDAVLAGVFSGANALSGTLEWKWLLPGVLFGAVIGMVLHVLPAEPRVTDARSGRITIRGICGSLGGAWAGLGFAYVASGYPTGHADQPTVGDLLPHLLVGALTGGLWYLIWGIWETRDGAPRV